MRALSILSKKLAWGKTDLFCAHVITSRTREACQALPRRARRTSGSRGGPASTMMKCCAWQLLLASGGPHANLHTLCLCVLWESMGNTKHPASRWARSVSRSPARDGLRRGDLSEHLHQPGRKKLSSHFGPMVELPSRQRKDASEEGNAVGYGSVQCAAVTIETCRQPWCSLQSSTRLFVSPIIDEVGAATDRASALL